MSSETHGAFFHSPFSHVVQLPSVIAYPNVPVPNQSDESQFLSLDRRYSITSLSDLSSASPLLSAPSPRSSGSRSMSPATSSGQQEADILSSHTSFGCHSQSTSFPSLPCGSGVPHFDGGATWQHAAFSQQPRQQQQPSDQQSFTFVPVNHLFGDDSILPTLPSMQQIERPQVTSNATLAASCRRRTAAAKFACPVPNCNATFTRRFNLRGHLRAHAEQRPFLCAWSGCGKSFSRAHDCKRHESLHCSKAPYLVCDGCNKPFSRSDSLRRHWRSDGGKKCRERGDAAMAEEEAYESLLESIGLP